MATIIKGSKGTAYPNSNKQYPLYAMQITLMHKGLVMGLFRWRETLSSDIMGSSLFGEERWGLGVWNLRKVNLVALARLCWRLLQQPQAL